MKKSTLIMAAIVLISSAVFAQKEKKPSINKALKSFQGGDLAAAKSEIDRAAEFEKTSTNGKTWYYRGLIYAAIDTSSTQGSLAENALEVAMESFNKADELHKGSSEYFITDSYGLPVLKPQQIDGLWGVYLNEGVKYFQNKEAEDAVKNFAKCTIVKPQDTTAYLYGGLASQSGKMYDEALKYFNKYIELGGTGEDVYASIIYITGTVKEDKEGALAMIETAMEKYPKNTTFPKQKIDVLIQLDKIDEAKNGLISAIEKEPENPQLYFSLAIMYDQLGELDNARKAYENSLQADPTFFNSRFNLAVMVYNEAVEYIKEKNALGISRADQKKADELQKTIDLRLKEAQPHWEKVLESDPNDRTALETLKYIFVQTKNMDKAEEIQARLDALGEVKE
ncbi:MAG: tetratricopeptide repeat protein [Cyclobacteriaceae bacterium]|nr:tetratricopeptide repeat protein [Cyclobacteriaceae bacterium]